MTRLTQCSSALRRRLKPSPRGWGLRPPLVREEAPMTTPRKGGRRKGDSGRRNDGLLKRCGCARKRWSECPHDWWFNLCVDKVSFRFNMTKRAGLPPKKALSRSEAERYRDHFRTLA